MAGPGLAAVACSRRLVHRRRPRRFIIPCCCLLLLLPLLLLILPLLPLLNLQARRRRRPPRRLPHRRERRLLTRAARLPGGGLPRLRLHLCLHRLLLQNRERRAQPRELLRAARRLHLHAQQRHAAHVRRVRRRDARVGRQQLGGHAGCAAAVAACLLLRRLLLLGLLLRLMLRRLLGAAGRVRAVVHGHSPGVVWRRGVVGQRVGRMADVVLLLRRRWRRHRNSRRRSPLYRALQCCQLLLDRLEFARRARSGRWRGPLRPRRRRALRWKRLLSVAAAAAAARPPLQRAWRAHRVRPRGADTSLPPRRVRRRRLLLPTRAYARLRPRRRALRRRRLQQRTSGRGAAAGVAVKLGLLLQHPHTRLARVRERAALATQISGGEDEVCCVQGGARLLGPARTQTPRAPRGRAPA